ncbi:MAG: S1/P1 nuclease [Alistipes sp.]|nr:S1/P1 nuclease [Alistipes sp.]
MKRKIVTLLLVVVATLGVQRAMAWAAFGHGAIAYVAEQHLTPEAKSEVRRYLNHTLPFYASWMDHWRAIEPYAHTNMWHGIKSDEKGKLRWDISGERANGQAMIQVKRIVEEMKGYRNMPDSLVRQNVIYLIHSVADMHCPVHVQFPKTTYPHYRYKLRNKGKPYQMHSFWDAAPAFTRNNWTYERYAQEVDMLTSKQAKKIQKGSYDVWGKDILKQTHRAYQITPADKDIARMTVEERAEVLSLADEMAMKAAYRLAYILNNIFGAK